MNITKKTSLSTFNSMMVWLVSKIMGLFKLSFVVGSQHAMLSCSSMVLPLSGIYGVVIGAIILCSFNIGLRFFFGHFSCLSVLAFYIPGLCASLYFASHHWIIRVLLPFMCMLAFIFHPVGGEAWIYSLYWLIPIALYFIKPQAFFYQALGATFVAHAVGSIIWLYTVEMSASMWLGLIPVVACERIAYAAGMVVAYHVLQSLNVAILHTSKVLYRSIRYCKS